MFADVGGVTTDIFVATQGYITTQNSIGSFADRTTVNIAGDSTGVTKALNDNTTAIATTAFVRQEVADLIGSTWCA